MGNERRTHAGGGLDQAPHDFAVADKLIQFCCATRDLGDPLITDGRTLHRDFDLPEEVAEGRIGWRKPKLNPQCAGESDVVAEGEPLEITKAFASSVGLGFLRCNRCREDRSEGNTRAGCGSHVATGCTGWRARN